MSSLHPSRPWAFCRPLWSRVLRVCSAGSIAQGLQKVRWNPGPRLLGERCPTSLKMVRCEEGGGISLCAETAGDAQGTWAEAEPAARPPSKGRQVRAGWVRGRDRRAPRIPPSTGSWVRRAGGSRPRGCHSLLSSEYVAVRGGGRRILALKGSAGANPPCPGLRDLWGEGWCVRSAHGVGSLRPRVRPAPGRRGPSTRAAAPLPHRARLLVPCPPPRSVSLALKGQPRGGTSRRASGRDAGCGSVPSRTAPMASQAFPEAPQALRQLESPRCSPPAGAGRQLFPETPSRTHTLDSKEPRKGRSRDFGLGGSSRKGLGDQSPASWQDRSGSPGDFLLGNCH